MLLQEDTHLHTHAHTQDIKHFHVEAEYTTAAVHFILL